MSERKKNKEKNEKIGKKQEKRKKKKTLMARKKLNEFECECEKKKFYGRETKRVKEERERVKRGYRVILILHRERLLAKVRVLFGMEMHSMVDIAQI